MLAAKTYFQRVLDLFSRYVDTPSHASTHPDAMTTIVDVERAAGFSVRVAVIDYYMHDGVNTHISRRSAAAASSASSSGFPSAHPSAGQRKPVVRIFGATPAGQKSCVHVHGVFPYFFVALGANLDDLTSRTGGAQGYLARMQASIEEAVRQTNNAGDGGGKGNGGKGGGGKGHGGKGWGGKGNGGKGGGGKGRGGGGGFGASAAGRGWGRGGDGQKCVQKLQLVDGRRFYGYHGSTEPFVRVSVRMILHSYTNPHPEPFVALSRTMICLVCTGKCAVPPV